MEYIRGISLNDFSALDDAGLDRKAIARNLAKSIFNQILRDGFFHGDPHPGNIMVLPDDTIVFLDFGMVGKLTPERKTQFLKMLLGIVFRNSRLIIESIVNLDAIEGNINTRKLDKDINKLRDKYIDMPLEEIKIGEVFNKIFNLAFSYNIVIPTEFTMLAKTIVTLEGIVEKLDPQLNVLEVAEPIARKLMFKAFSVSEIRKGVLNTAIDYSRLMSEVPSFFLNFLRKLENDNYIIELRIKDIENFERRTDRVFNRLSSSIILLALSIIIAGILIGSGMSANTGIEIYTLNVIILKLGLAIAFIMFLVLIISIFRSGRL